MRGGMAKENVLVSPRGLMPWLLGWGRLAFQFFIYSRTR